MSYRENITSIRKEVKRYITLESLSRDINLMISYDKETLISFVIFVQSILKVTVKYLFP